MVSIGSEMVGSLLGRRDGDGAKIKSDGQGTYGPDTAVAFPAVHFKVVIVFKGCVLGFVFVIGDIR